MDDEDERPEEQSSRPPAHWTVDASAGPEEAPAAGTTEPNAAQAGDDDVDDEDASCPLAPELRKYWAQRHKLFSRFDEGVLMDYEGWFSVTPECIAQQIAENCRCALVIDAFCGVGGNTIQFAFTCERVIAIDTDPVKLLCAQHNAKIYGVEDRIEFILGDFLTLAPSLKADVVFLSPPWGGPEYADVNKFDIGTMMKPNGIKIFQAAARITPNIAYYVPRNVNLSQMRKLSRRTGGDFYVECNRVGRRVKAITCYYGLLGNEEYFAARDAE